MNERDRNRAIVVLDLLGEEITDEAINDWMSSGEPGVEELRRAQEEDRKEPGAARFTGMGSDVDLLPCGCKGKCDPYAHDTHPDGLGKPAGPAFDDLTPEGQREYLENHEWERCTQCGNRCPEGDEICGHCAAENQQVEDSVNDGRDQ